MGTRATILFKDRDEEYFVYRGHDGYPSNVIEDINDALAAAKGRWSDPELGCLVSLMISMNYDHENRRLPLYEITTAFHGDESYRYQVEWNGEHYEVNVK